MKAIIIWFIALIILCNKLYSQELILKGRVKCIVQNPNSTKGAENVVVLPNFSPPKATLTVTKPSGYFEINTGVPLSKLEDKTVTMYAISRCKNCNELVKRVFITEDTDRKNKNDKNTYCTIKDWMLNNNCKQVEMRAFTADSILRITIKQPDQNLEHVSGATALVSTPSLLNFLTSLTTVLGPTFGGTFEAKSLYPGKIAYGQFLHASPLSHSANTGFNFAPNRDMSEAVFWNPSAIRLSNKSTNISLLTNLKNNHKLSAYHQFANKLGIGGGFIYTKQDEFRKIIFNINGVPTDTRELDSMNMNLKEYAGFISFAYKLTNNLSFGMSVKSIWQEFNIPDSLFAQNRVFNFTDMIIKKQNIDIDISASYKVNSALQLGMNLMNLAGNQLFNDAFVANEPDKPVQNQRSLGLGFLYKWQRFNFGADFLLADGGLYDAEFGLNYVPFNNALISAGIAVNQLSYSLAFRIKHFRIAYINDNDFLINEKRKGKSAIFNGNIYGGFVFDLK